MAAGGRYQGLEPGARGRALLVEGFTAGGEVAAPASPMGQLCELLLASRGFETVRYLTPRAAARNRPSRLALRFHIETLIGSDSPLTLVALDRKAPGRRGRHRARRVRDARTAARPRLGAARVAGRRARRAGTTAPDPGVRRLGLARGCRGCPGAVSRQRTGAARRRGPGSIESCRSGRARTAGGRGDPAKRNGFLRQPTKSSVAPRGCCGQGSGSSTPFLIPPSPLGLWGFGAAARDGRAAAKDLAGRTLPGQFHLQAVLDSGGFGTVYAARQLTLERDVAVKVVEAATTASARAVRQRGPRHRTARSPRTWSASTRPT